MIAFPLSTQTASVAIASSDEVIHGMGLLHLKTKGMVLDFKNPGRANSTISSNSMANNQCPASS